MLFGRVGWRTARPRGGGAVALSCCAGVYSSPSSRARSPEVLTRAGMAAYLGALGGAGGFLGFHDSDRGGMGIRNLVGIVNPVAQS